MLKMPAADVRGQTDRHQHPELVMGVHGDVESTDDQQRKKQHHSQRSHQTKLFADNGKDEVVFRLRQIQILLPGFAQTQTEQSARANGNQRLTGLPGVAQAVGERVTPGGDTLSDILIVSGHQKADEQRRTQRHSAQDQKLLDICAAHEDQNDAGHGNQNGGRKGAAP